MLRTSHSLYTSPKHLKPLPPVCLSFSLYPLILKKKMYQGRDSATSAMVFPILCLLLAAAHLATADEYTVGDSSGWSFNVVNWPNGKSFKAGDVIGEFL